MVRVCKKKIGLLHHAGGGNLGDDASIDAVLSNIRSRWSGAEIFAFTMNPVDTQKRHGDFLPLQSGNRYGLPTVASRTVGESLKEKTKAVLRKYGYVFRLLRAIKAAAVAPQAIAKEVVFLAKSLRIIRSFDLLVITGGGQLLDTWSAHGVFPTRSSNGLCSPNYHELNVIS